jgi:hypothetical protein
MDKHERAAVSARITLIEQTIADLPDSGLSPVEQSKRVLALQSEWMELTKSLMHAEQRPQHESNREVAATG